VLIVTVFLGAVAVSHLSPEADEGLPLRSISWLIVVTYAFSIASAYAVPRVVNLSGFALLQVVAEILLISAAVLLTGALHSPMAVWYNLAIIGAAILLFRHGAYTAAALSSLTYGTLMNLVYYGVVPAAIGMAPAREPGFGVLYHVAANIASFFSIAFLSSILVQRTEAAERALEESQANFQRVDTLQRVLIQNLETGVLTTDADGIIKSANQAIETIVGRGAAGLLGRRISEVFPVLRPPVGPKRVFDPSPIPIELTHRATPDAEEQVLRCTSAPLADTYQNLIGTLYIVQDVTPLKDFAAEPEPEPSPIAKALQRSDLPRISGLLGQSPPMLQIAALIHKVAPTESTVLITGESGTGKELAARAIHALSSRRDKPMVVVNCAAIPANLIESELFGHVRGAFTGAVADRRGLFRAADGGTIFLDEVGDLPLSLQVKLLRVLQERSFTPVGSAAQVAVDVRVIAATNRDLEAAVRAGNFREDLYYRLNVIRVEMPPLRERVEDIPMLIEHFLARFSEELERPRCKLSPEAMRKMVAHRYPGNIRELENLVEHMVAIAEGEVIKEEDLPSGVRDGSTPPARRPADHELPATTEASWMTLGSSNLDAELEAIEKRLLEEALRRAGGVRKRAAEILGINYRSLRHRLSKYGFGDLDAREARD
jgi:PAS domain S-box-containing protein